MAEVPVIPVELVYATPEKQDVMTLQVASGSTVRDVIEASGILDREPQIDLRHDGVGIYGRRVALTAAVTAHDRVEIYRPLQADPKLVRRELARQGRVMGSKKKLER